MRRRTLLGASLGVLAAHAGGAGARAPASLGCLGPAVWSAFVARHVQADGRVVDFDTPRQHATSEGQGYALFLALVHNQPLLFERLLRWTEDNLAGGSLARQLPAWQWGRRDDGTWGVVDPNAASDADLWIAYALLEAGRLWRRSEYTERGVQLLALVEREEVMDLPGLGPMLLPWPRSAASGPAWRLNPSYLPMPLLRRMAQLDPAGPWPGIAQATVRMVAAVAPQGFAPDWCAWSQTGQGFVQDPGKAPVGGYDAIRVYLWAGLGPPGDAAQAALLETLAGPRRALEQAAAGMPERVDVLSGKGDGTAPLGFGGALLPYLRAQQLTALFDAQLARIRERLNAPEAAALPYYERMLLLFGLAHVEGHCAFDAQGRLQPRWSALCPSSRPA